MKLIRKILVKVLGLKGYLKLISRIYLRMMSMGMMKGKYNELHFISRIVKPGDTVIDIGANLSYYSYFIAKAQGTSGKLLAVEPIPLFADIWKRNMRKYKNPNIKLFNCALGQEAQDEVTMSIPIVNGVVRHGLTKVSEEGDQGESALSFAVPMKVGDELLGPEVGDKLDFVKCDVEGFEQYVMPSLENTISKHMPLIQIELSGKENRQAVVDFLCDKGYQIAILNGNKLNDLPKDKVHTVDQDFYFLTSDLREKRTDLFG